MDPTTKAGREALRGLLADLPAKITSVNVAGEFHSVYGWRDRDQEVLCKVAIPTRAPEDTARANVTASTIVAALTALPSALSHIEKLETDRDVIEREMIQEREEAELLAAERDALRADLERARLGLAAVEYLINDSRGVDGLHLNGDLATWDELRTGGRYEEWLMDFDAALSPSPAALDAPKPYEPRKRPKGSNADEWQLFLIEHANASAFLAVQIAEAIDDASKGAGA